MMGEAYLLRNTSRVHISKRVLVAIPTPKAQIQATNKSDSVINHNELLVMRPVERHIRSILKHVVIRVAHEDDISVPRASFWAKIPQSFLRVLRVASKGCFHLAVYTAQGY
jgi:hypothetical protein